MIVNKYNKGGGSDSGVTPQDVQRQIDSALTPYWESGETKDYVDEAISDISLDDYYTSAQTEEAISAATAGKADAANVSANTDSTIFPTWNEQGIITGEKRKAVLNTIKLNGYPVRHFAENVNGISWFAPINGGTAGDILVSTGPYGAPVWSAMTFPTPDVDKAYVDSAITEVQDQIDTMDEVVSAALVDLKDKIDEISGATPSVDLSGYYTSAQTEEAISVKVESAYTILDAHITEVEQVTASAYTELHNDILEVSARTAPDMSLYTPTSGFSTINGSAITNGGNIVIEGGGDMSDYWNSAQTKTYVDSGITVVQGQIDIIDEVVSSALVDLKDKIDEISASTPSINLSAYTPTTGFSTINGSAITNGGNIVIQGGEVPQLSAYTTHDEFDTWYPAAACNLLVDAGIAVQTSAHNYGVETSAVTSDYVNRMWKGTQAEYDLISVKDPYTFYIIIDNN